MPLLYSFLIFLAVAYPSIWIVVLIHELGHAVCARLIGHKVTSLGLGTGKPFFRTVLPGGTILFLCRENSTTGTCWTTASDLLPARKHLALLYTSGGLTNLLVAVICFLLWSQPYGAIWIALTIMNALIGIANLFPSRHKIAGNMTVASDGLQTILLFVSRRSRISVPQSELGMRKLWQEIGDTRTERFRLTLTAFAAHHLEANELAEQFRKEAEALPADATDAHLLFLQGSMALQKKEMAPAREFLMAAREEYERQQVPGSVFQCNLLLLFTYPMPEAIVAWNQLARSPFARRSHIATALAGLHLLLFLSDSEMEEDVATLETLIARYESARRHYRNDIDEANIYARVAVWRKNLGDSVGAQLAWDRVSESTHYIEEYLAHDQGLANWYRQYVTGEAKRLGFESPFPGVRLPTR